MTPYRIPIPWRQARVLVYLIVIAALFLARGNVRWKALFPGGRAGAGDTLVVAGRDLAPGLVDRLAAVYHKDYPSLVLVITGGGTNRALEDLINGRANVAFLVRPPSAREQGLFQSVAGDSAVWFPVALGGIALVAGGAGPDSVTREDVADLGEGRAPSRFHRVYAPDPNRGLWDALLTSLGKPPEDPPAGSAVVFLKDEAAVLDAVRSDPEAVGLASTLALPEPFPSGVFMMRAGRGHGEAVLPTYETIASGGYPLIHDLYAACRGTGDIQGSKFVTHLTGGPGQRQVERAGCVPALLYLREVVLTDHPLGQ
jgi:ABC-type phosphate transport system substrate-binding protein